MLFLFRCYARGREMDKEKHPNRVICPRCGRAGSKQSYTKKCGKPNCGKCPHGPYWYVAHRVGGKVRFCYIGKTWPEEPSDEAINYMIQAGVAKSREEAIKHYKKVNAPRDNEPK